MPALAAEMLKLFWGFQKWQMLQMLASCPASQLISLLVALLLLYCRACNYVGRRQQLQCQQQVQ
jgi:hypothetical protein